ncbi:MAG: hypothetical protein GQ570_03660 [Helicobacteraceae bacterium]|nr:hypothetical protein [Helicobacteraceae bacterium]
MRMLDNVWVVKGDDFRAMHGSPLPQNLLCDLVITTYQQVEPLNELARGAIETLGRMGDMSRLEIAYETFTEQEYS